MVSKWRAICEQDNQKLSPSTTHDLVSRLSYRRVDLVSDKALAVGNVPENTAKTGG